MKLEDISRLILDAGLTQNLDDPVLFSENVKLVLKKYSPEELDALSVDFWQKEIPTMVNIKGILETNDAELKKDLPLGPIEYLKSVITEEINEKVLQILKN